MEISEPVEFAQSERIDEQSHETPQGTDPIQQPELIPVSTTNELFLHDLEQRILDNPVRFARVLERLGTDVVANSLERDQIDETAKPDRTNLPHLISFYFTQRVDRGGFDDATEDALADSKDIAEEVERLASLRNFRVKVSSMSTRETVNAEAVPTRDKIRYDRLRFFAMRAIEWQQQAPEQSSSVVAGAEDDKDNLQSAS